MLYSGGWYVCYIVVAVCVLYSGGRYVCYIVVAGMCAI